LPSVILRSYRLALMVTSRPWRAITSRISSVLGRNRDDWVAPSNEMTRLILSDVALSLPDLPDYSPARETPAAETPAKPAPSFSLPPMPQSTRPTTAPEAAPPVTPAESPGKDDDTRAA